MHVTMCLCAIVCESMGKLVLAGRHTVVKAVIERGSA